VIFKSHNVWIWRDAVTRMADQLTANLEAFVAGAPGNCVA
jgi:lactate dehydrogenase-like 2-hydroxyacid dehydrogenase